MGLPASRWDIAYSETHNVTTSGGLSRWLSELSFTSVGCLVWFGTPCSSFLLMCKASSQRDRQNGWVGNTDREFVSTGNKLMAITSLLFFIAWVLGCRCIIEQPLQSCLVKLKPLSSVLSFAGTTRSVTWLGAFGSLTPKPLQLHHTHRKFASLRRRQPTLKIRHLLVNKLQGGRFRGKAKELKASQCYTEAFGRAVAAIQKELG